MTILTKVLYSISILQILHSGFSSFEFHQLTKNMDPIDYPLPRDIKLECYMGLILFIFTCFLSFKKLQYYPIKPTEGSELNLLSTNQYLKDISLNKANNVHNLIGDDPHGEVSFTPSLVNIQKKREEIALWLKTNSSKK